MPVEPAELAQLLELLLDASVEFILVGGGAAVIHGAPVTTRAGTSGAGPATRWGRERLTVASRSGRSHPRFTKGEGLIPLHCRG